MERVRSSDDFRDLLSSFAANGVRFLIVGGFALGHYARPRYTKDLDIWVDSAGDNPERVMRALIAFGAPVENVSPEDFRVAETVFQLGVEPHRVDILSAIDGVEFSSAWPNRREAQYFGVDVSVIGREDLIANKRASGRARDLRDVEELLENG